MAEFTEIIKIRNKMHKKYNIKDICTNCPLSIEINGFEIGCMNLEEKYPEEYERICLD